MGVLTGKKKETSKTEATRRQESVRKPLGQHPSADGEYHQLAAALRVAPWQRPRKGKPVASTCKRAWHSCIVRHRLQAKMDLAEVGKRKHYILPSETVSNMSQHYRSLMCVVDGVQHRKKSALTSTDTKQHLESFKSIFLL